MKCKSSLGWSGAFLAAALLFTGNAVAQRIHGPASAQRSAAYDVSRDVTLIGTVLNYTESSDAPPNGAHVLLQTPSGSVDVHLGDARFLKLNNFSIAESGTLRVVGQMTAIGGRGIFLARIVQQGTRALAVRSEKGVPLAGAGLRANPAAPAQPQRGGAR